jgi:hypothetical protein
LKKFEVDTLIAVIAVLYSFYEIKNKENLALCPIEEGAATP